MGLGIWSEVVDSFVLEILFDRYHIFNIKFIHGNKDRS